MIMVKAIFHLGDNVHHGLANYYDIVHYKGESCILTVMLFKDEEKFSQDGDSKLEEMCVRRPIAMEVKKV